MEVKLRAFEHLDGLVKKVVSSICVDFRYIVYTGRRQPATITDATPSSSFLPRTEGEEDERMGGGQEGPRVGTDDDLKQRTDDRSNADSEVVFARCRQLLDSTNHHEAVALLLHRQWLRVLGGYPEDWPDHPLPLGERCVEALQEGLAAEAQRSYDMRSQNEPVERLLQLCRLLVGDAGDPARVLSAQYRLYCEDSEASERLTQRG
eukprot:GHVU01128547.1.p2 GENE.GHVU01128547.1~~GHVU01128547.1.p2  ORF type:complete len:206 (-),score=38.37 GHVU01128547.1:513-1130(-)